MSAPIKLAAFAAALAVLFGGGAVAGGAVGPDREGPRAAHADTTSQDDGAHSATKEEHETVSASPPDGTESKSGGHGASASRKAAHPVRGLAVVGEA